MAVAANRWQIVASVLLTRRPVVAPPLSAVEKTYKDLLWKREVDKSLLCDFELKSIADEKLEKKRLELLEKGKEMSELDGELGLTNTMRIDEWEKKHAILTHKLKAGVSVPDGMDSIERLPERRLTLLVKQRFGREDYSSPWILPQATHREGESLRETAERCLSLFDRTFNVSNAPFAVHTFKYPKGVKEKLKNDVIGSKMFFFSVDVTLPLSSPDVKEIAEFRWVTADELSTLITRRKYRRAISAALIE